MKIENQKTTYRIFLRKMLIAIIAASGKRSGIVVNDYGKETYEDDFIQSHQISIEYLRGG